MRLEEFISLLDAKPAGQNEWEAHCPAHDDRKESLSVSVGDNGSIVLYCHAGCETSAILEHMGLTFADLYPDENKADYPCYKPNRGKEISSNNKEKSGSRFDFNNIVATYHYRNGTRKLRDSNKNFMWQHLEGNTWKSKRGNAPRVLYTAGSPQDILFIVEGEKDCNTMAELGFWAASSENGAGKRGKWYPEYNHEVESLSVVIIPDNDDIGRAFAEQIANEILSYAKSVKLLDLRMAWSDISKHQDVSDMVEALGQEEAARRINDLEKAGTLYKPGKRSMSAILKSLHPESNSRYRWSDIGNGNLFADVYKDVARYCSDRGLWYVFTGKRWEPDSKDGVRTMQLCKKLADALMIYAITIGDEKYSENVRNWQSRNKRCTILKDAQDCYPVSGGDFDKDIFLLNCKNGTLDLQSFRFRPHDPADLISKIANVYYNPEATCNRWNDFINEIMEADKDKAKYLKRALGYTLTGDTKEECFFILYGATSRNGKGTLMESFKNIMGDYGRAASPESITQKDKADSSRPSEDIARLSGARFVNISEPDKSMVLSSALIKTLTGNDTIRARYLHENSFEFKPQFKLFINTNHLPRVTDPTVFDSDRIKVVTFTKHFEEDERDKNLKRLFSKKEYASAILNWCIEGLKDYQQNGLSVPASVREDTKQYAIDSDDIARFIDDELISDYREEVRTSDAYERYKEWCGQNGFYQKSIKTFSQDLKQRGITILTKRPREGGNPCSIIITRKLS